MHRSGVRNVNSAGVREVVLTFDAYTVRNVNSGAARAARLTKCTANRASLNARS